jgi:DnaA family protein
VDLPLREDLRSRLAWGLVFALQPLPESQTREVLQGEAARRGIRLSEDLLDHLMHRHARDLGFLMRLFEELDAYALSQSRPVTVPLLRRMLAQAGDLAAMAPSSRLHLVE